MPSAYAPYHLFFPSSASFYISSFLFSVLPLPLFSLSDHLFPVFLFLSTDLVLSVSIFCFFLFCDFLFHDPFSFSFSFLLSSSHSASSTAFWSLSVSFLLLHFYYSFTFSVALSRFSVRLLLHICLAVVYAAAKINGHVRMVVSFLFLCRPFCLGGHCQATAQPPPSLSWPLSGYHSVADSSLSLSVSVRLRPWLCLRLRCHPCTAIVRRCFFLAACPSFRLCFAVVSVASFCRCFSLSFCRVVLRLVCYSTNGLAASFRVSGLSD